MENGNIYKETIKAFDDEAVNPKGMFNKDLTECDRLSLEALNMMIRKDMKVLEIGCGMGNVIENLKETRIEKHCIDISEKMLEKCTIANKKVADMDNLPYDDNEFNVVFMIMTFQHSKDPQKTITEATRVLRPEGHLVIIDGDKDSAIGRSREISVKDGTYRRVGDARWISKGDFPIMRSGNLAPHILWLELNK